MIYIVIISTNVKYINILGFCPIKLVLNPFRCPNTDGNSLAFDKLLNKNIALSLWPNLIIMSLIILHLKPFHLYTLLITLVQFPCFSWHIRIALFQGYSHELQIVKGFPSPSSKTALVIVDFISFGSPFEGAFAELLLGKVVE